MLNKLIFGMLLAVIPVAAIPYGTVEPWWKAAFVCAVFAVCILAIIQSGSLKFANGSVLLPMLALTVLAFVQTLSLGSQEVGEVNVWNTISADPFQTRFFALQMGALTAWLALLYRYANTDRHMRLLLYTILAVAVVSAVFGILRQATQHQTGFVLPLLRQSQGYGQFVNKNHFAYLMEMAFGLGTGIALAGGVKRDRVLIYIALLLPIWTALVLSNSRGGVLAMLVQIVSAALLLSSRSLNALRVALLVVLVAGVLFGTLWVGGDRLASNFGNVLNPGDETNMRAGVSRNEIWRGTLKMFAAHPITGVGLGGYWIGITAFHDASGLMTPQEAHNDYLELLSSGGIVGFAMGVWFAMQVIRAARTNLLHDTGYSRALRLGAILGIIGVAAHSLVDFGLHILINAIVFLSLIMIATVRSGNDYATR
ncbi:MAG TPA: O-antigen ligase family protein [Pyrinomonadaceae bacterium]|nr:O-antigen ligase family protein [Pyrinomonadaceae bacterium]